MSKPKVATTSLAGCFGCHMSLLDIDDRILQLIDLIDFDKSPVDDIKEFTGRCLVGLVEGGCANEENVAVLRELRERAKVLVALGDCARTGCVPALRNAVPLRECLREAYLDGPSVLNPEGRVPDDEEIPLLLERVLPCDEVVRVDVFLPGCPARPEAIREGLLALLQDRPLALSRDALKFD